MELNKLRQEYELVHNQWFHSRSKDDFARKNQLVSLMAKHGIAPGQKKETQKVKSNLLGKFAVEGKAVTNTETGEVRGDVEKEAADVGQEKLRAALEEWEQPKIPAIKSRSDVEFWLRQRMLVLQEYAYVYEESRKILAALDSRLENWSFLFTARLEEWFKQNPPTTGKSMKTIYGSLQCRNQAASVVLDHENQADLYEELAELSDELKAEFDVRPVTSYSMNLPKLTKWYQDRIEQADNDKKKRPLFRGLLYKAAVPNKFSVGPSLETVKDKVRKGNWEGSNV